MGSGLSAIDKKGSPTQTQSKAPYAIERSTDDNLEMLAEASFRRLRGRQLADVVAKIILPDDQAKKYFHRFLKHRSAAMLLSTYFVRIIVKLDATIIHFVYVVDAKAPDSMIITPSHTSL
jgi:hypothetical protein